MGHSSQRTVTPSTRGVVPTAKAPSLWKYGVQRVVGEQSTQRTRKLSTRVFFLVYAGEMESNTGEVLWMPPKWKQMLHGSSMEIDQRC